MTVTIKDYLIIAFSLALLFATIGLAPTGQSDNVKVHFSENQKKSEGKLVSSPNFKQFNVKNKI